MGAGVIAPSSPRAWRQQSWRASNSEQGNAAHRGGFMFNSTCVAQIRHVEFHPLQEYGLRGTKRQGTNPPRWSPIASRSATEARASRIYRRNIRHFCMFSVDFGLAPRQ